MSRRSHQRSRRHHRRTGAPRNTILLGDAHEQLRRLPTASVDVALTSPPYFLLRNYGVEGQAGLESDVDAYADNLATVCDELGRVLKPSGSLWLNLGDGHSRHRRFGAERKSMLLGPERVVLRLIERGWRLRNKVIWHKTNPMPQAAVDRLSGCWEVVYFLTRADRYFFDLDAIREPQKSSRKTFTRPGNSETAYVGPVQSKPKYTGTKPAWSGPYGGSNHGLAQARAEGRHGHRSGRKNPGDVWSLPTARYKGAHFATFSPELLRRPLLATSPLRTCRRCGTPWRQAGLVAEAPQCDCRAGYRPGLVLDPFMGAGTVGVVAKQLGYDYLGIELNDSYRAIAHQRIASTSEPVRDAPEPRGGDAPSTT